MASIVDKPKESQQSDLLEIERYTDGLIKFIQSAATPITIGVQGEWGSGKTSLLNTIREELCDRAGANNFGIWINTWEYSLLSHPDETLIKIIINLINQIGVMSNNKSEESFQRVLSISRKLLSGASKSSSTIGAVASAANAVLNEGYNDATIQELRESLQTVIDKAINSSQKDSFIFFIDDLDRLDPTVAVSILELLKNLFDLQHCIFVIAIDYSVVVKGLRSKFGEMTEENEWEFRAFFDKIIQLPFSMPISNYNISRYIQSLLIDVDYFDKKDLHEQSTLKKISDVVSFSVGTNPRSLKRLANSVALIEFIRGSQELTLQERIIEFSLICMQIAYPVLYALIQQEPDFVHWDDKFTMSVLKNKDIDEKALEALKESEEFDEDWEQNLWRICQANTFLKERSYLISKLLNFIRQSMPSDQDMSATMERLLSMSSVTSVNTETVKKIKSTKGIYYVNVGDGITRSWEDMRTYNFISAGQDQKYNKFIINSNIGDIVAMYFAGKGYVGIGRIVKKAVPVNEFLFDGEQLTHEMLKQPGLFTNSENKSICEWLAEVEWIVTVDSDEAKSAKKGTREYKIFTSPIIRASLDNQPDTIEYLNEVFDIDLQKLLGEP